ncbi:MAG: hypothetical protein WC240_07555 [Bacilli bacterium]|jgi:hypothetical protein|nr:hypothetical protein [Clostridia bacterium]
MREYTREILLTSAKECELSSNQTKRFLTFADNWIALNPGQNRPSFDSNYADTWAMRFRREEEYVYAVGDALYALVKTDGEQVALLNFVHQLRKYDPRPIEEAMRQAKTEIAKVTVKYGTLKGRKTSCMCKKSIKKPSKIIGNLPNFDANFRKLI